MPIDATIADVARGQHGLVSVDQIRALGGNRRMLERRVGSGSLLVLTHRVFALRGSVPSWERAVLAAVLDAGTGAAASHLTAAALWGLDGFGRVGRPEVSFPRGRNHRPIGALVHQSSDLDRCSLVLRDGIPTTDLTRTLLDLGRHIGWRRLDRVTENARRVHGLQTDTLLHTLLRHARQGRHGVRRLRTVVERHLDRTEVTDSEFEMVVLTLLRERGIPDPVLHHRISAGDVLLAEVDLAWPDRRVALELHGQQHREDRRIWEADQRKAVELQALGWSYLPFTWRQYVDAQEWMLGRIRAAVVG